MCDALVAHRATSGRSVWRGRQRAAVGTIIDRMTHHAAPTPDEHVTDREHVRERDGPGSANTSPRNGSVVPAWMRVELVNVVTGRVGDAIEQPPGVRRRWHEAAVGHDDQHVQGRAEGKQREPRQVQVAEHREEHQGARRDVQQRAGVTDAITEDGPEQQQLEARGRRGPSAHQRMWISASADTRPPAARPTSRPMTMAYSRSIRRQRRRSGFARHGALQIEQGREDVGRQIHERRAVGGAPNGTQGKGSPAAAAAIVCRRSPVSVRGLPPAERRGQHECEGGQGGEPEGEGCGSVHGKLRSVSVIWADLTITRRLTRREGPVGNVPDNTDYASRAPPPSIPDQYQYRSVLMAAPRPVRRRRRARAAGRILGRMDDPRLLETTIASRVILTGRYLTVRVDTIRDADGGEHTREVVDHPGAVAILAIHDGSVLMVHQYRTPTGRVLLEIPAGHPGTRRGWHDRRPDVGRSAGAGRGDRPCRRHLAPPGQLLHGARLHQRVHAPVPRHGPLPHRGVHRSGCRRAI